MKKSRFSEEQIVAILKDGELGLPVIELCRKHGISQSTYYKWQTKYAGLSTSELRRLKQLEQENAKLKQMYADISLEHRALKDIIEKKLHIPHTGDN